MLQCDECGQPRIRWGGAWLEHSDNMHQYVRRQMYRNLWLRLGRHVWKKATGE